MEGVCVAYLLKNKEPTWQSGSWFSNPWLAKLCQGKGRAFCAGGDVAAVVNSIVKGCISICPLLQPA